MACQITLSEREQVAQFRSQQLTKAEIARRLGRHRSTIGRELARNSDGASYWPSRAQQKAQARRLQRPRKMDEAQLSERVRQGLVRYWSPEQIAGRAAREFPEQRRERGEAGFPGSGRESAEEVNANSQTRVRHFKKKFG